MNVCWFSATGKLRKDDLVVGRPPASEVSKMLPTLKG